MISVHTHTHTQNSSEKEISYQLYLKLETTELNKIVSYDFVNSSWYIRAIMTN